MIGDWASCADARVASDLGGWATRAYSSKVGSSEAGFTLHLSLILDGSMICKSLVALSELNGRSFR